VVAMTARLRTGCSCAFRSARKASVPVLDIQTVCITGPSNSSTRFQKWLSPQGFSAASTARNCPR
jgi:hypothetical protein